MPWDSQFFCSNTCHVGPAQPPLLNRGFSFTLTPPEGTPEGYYDVYVRALDGMGVACDMAAILHLKYGTPDEIRDSGRLISFPRIMKEGASALFGDAQITDDNIILPPDGGVRLGNIPLSAYEKLRITYTLTDTTESDDRTPVLGLKSSGRYSFGKDGEKYNVTDSLAFAALSTTANAVEIDLTDCLYNGEVWLTGHLDRKVVITSLQVLSSQPISGSNDWDLCNTVLRKITKYFMLIISSL